MSNHQLSAAAFDPNLIGPIFPSTPTFTIPTRPTVSTEPTGPTIFFTLPAPEPESILLEPNTNNVLIMEVLVPIESKNDKSLLNVTISCCQIQVFLETIKWVDTPGDPVTPPAPIHYRIVTNIGNLNENINLAIV
ncbi:exosporium leader peptide-containing protein [Bacillus wiedmannii]|uniref:exosporium leader peptide-containing protein n=1 Tax=Bacillus wiedmannii TaxID=1890302 RepID=UPI000B43AEDD|nr:hypothetical protein BK740_25795 [Bacillus thuringiensis serovar argentinensis]PEK65433.1 hypothetical protein CN595_01370 [Bacillus wiedmannii]PEU22253.1 hypothetical protein CN526_25360 [Bacillus wiedmannii]PHB37119.1 hypothetical protein COE82_24445 [Bacillus wiedmannii]PHC25508.1 hypothetical protein COF00_13450 [Bacillus wiedmannii]